MIMKKLRIFFACIGAVLVFLAGWFLRNLFGRKIESVVAKTSEEIKREIENTPADDLINDAPNSDELRANAAGIAEQSKQRLRDRIREVLSGNNSSGTDASGGSGN